MTAPNDWPGNNNEQSDGEVLVLEIWAMWSRPSFPLLPVTLWLKVEAPDKVLPMGQIEHTVFK